MDHVIEQVPAGAAGVEPPAVALGPQVRLECRVGLADDGLDPDAGGLADGTVGDELLGQLEGRVVDEALAHPQHLAGRQSATRPSSKASSTVLVIGFCTETCLPASRAALHVVVVQVGGGQDLDRVDVVVGEEGVDVGVDLGHAPALGGLAGDVAVDVAHRHHVAARVLEVAGDVQVGDVAGAEHPHPDRIGAAVASMALFSSGVGDGEAASSPSPAGGSGKGPNEPPPHEPTVAEVTRRYDGVR